jgi:glycosyltransferase involved in cell wall biosynthesis
MRVLAVTNLYPNPLQPQRASFNRRQLRFLHKRHPVRVIAPIAWTDELHGRRFGRTPLPPQRQRVADGMTIDHPRIYYVPGMLRNMYGRCFYWSIRKAFRRACREFRPTIVYAPWIYPDGWAAVKLAQEVGLPVVLKAHGSDVLSLHKQEGRRAGTLEALRLAQGIVAVSKDLAARIIELGANRQSTRVIYDGIEPLLFCPGSKPEARRKLQILDQHAMLLFIGNLVPVKGLDTLLDAAALLDRGGNHFQLHVIGEGPLRGKLLETTKHYGLLEKVHWHGSLPYAHLPDWYRAADVFVLPSRSEGVPNVLLEAAACQSPWVATRVGGIPEIAHLGASRLVEPDQPEALADAIAAMITSPPSMGDRPRCPEEMIDELSEFLLQIQERHRTARVGA